MRRNDKSRYNGCHMNIYGAIVPGAASLAHLYGINIPCVQFWYAREVGALTGGISKHEQEKRYIRPIN